MGGTEQGPTLASLFRGEIAVGDDEDARRAGGSCKCRRGWRRGCAVWGGSCEGRAPPPMRHLQAPPQRERECYRGERE
jgi:hypothetical protein